MTVLDRTTTSMHAEPNASKALPPAAVNKAQRAAGPIGLGLALAALATVVWSGSFVTSRALADSGAHSETRSTVAQLGYRIGAGPTGIRTITGVVDSFTVPLRHEPERASASTLSR